MNLEVAVENVINAKELRASLPELVKKVRKGARYTVLYRSRPAFEIGPVNSRPTIGASLKNEPFYRAKALGRSRDGLTAADHDAILYGK